jgi:CelD/BcsL family acetyltransferase involved in cellulose biosynthesis
MKIEEIDNYDDLTALEDKWRDLLARCDNSIFSTWEYLTTWWKYYGKKAKLRVLTAQENGELLGIAPLMIREYPFLYKASKINKIEFIGRGTSDYNDFIFQKEKEIPALFIKHLMKSSDWDLLELLDINEKISSANVLQALIANQVSKYEVGVSNLCPYIALPSSLQVYMNTLSRNLRKSLRRRLKKLKKEYRVDFKTHNDFGSVREAMKIFFKLYNNSWGSKGEPGNCQSTTDRDFHLELAMKFNNHNWLALHFLTVNDEPIAFIYSFEYKQKKYGLRTGFNHEFSRYGPGNLLRMHAIERCIRNSFKEYDLLRGNEPYKACWTTGIRKNLVVRMINKSWRGPLFLWIDNFKQRF